MSFGSTGLGNYLKVLSEDECDNTLSAAWDVGIRYYDTAPFYGFGLAEERVGRILRQKNRSEFIISTKVGRLLEPCPEDEVDGLFYLNVPPKKVVYDYSYDGVMKSYESSLKRLGLDRVDILYVHDVDGLVHGGREASEARIRELMDQGGWRALTELRDSGEISAIGAGVNEWQPCARLLELADPDLFMLAGRYTLLEQEPIDTLLPECARKGAGLVIGGPYNSGVLVGRDTFNYSEIPQEVAAKVQKIQSICDDYNVELPQAALHFVLLNPQVTTVVPGSQTVDEVMENASLLDKPVPQEFWQLLKNEGLIHGNTPIG